MAIQQNKQLDKEPELEKVTEKMVDDLLNEDYFQQRFSDLVRPVIERFQKAHPLIAASYSFAIQLEDGQFAVKGRLESKQRQRIKAIRKYREALALREARRALSKSAA